MRREALRNANEQTLSARVLVNAAGPWVNQVLARIYKPSGQEVDKLDAELVQGSHIVIKGDYQWNRNQAGTGINQFNVNLGYNF